MAIKKILAAAALVALAAPAFAQVRAVSEDECNRVGGTIEEDRGVCLLTPEQAANLSTSAPTQTANLGDGLDPAVGIGLAVLVIAVASGGSSSSTTTTAPSSN